MTDKNDKVLGVEEMKNKYQDKQKIQKEIETMKILDTRIIVTVFGIIFLMLGINYTKQVEKQHRELYELTVEHYAYQEFNDAIENGLKIETGLAGMSSQGESAMRLNAGYMRKVGQRHIARDASMVLPSLGKMRPERLSEYYGLKKMKPGFANSFANVEGSKVTPLTTWAVKQSKSEEATGKEAQDLQSAMAAKTNCPQCENLLEYMKAKAEEINQQALIQG